MKIVHVIEPMAHGVFIWVIDMANNLVRNGYEVTVIHSLREDTPKNWRDGPCYQSNDRLESLVSDYA